MVSEWWLRAIQLILLVVMLYAACYLVWSPATLPAIEKDKSPAGNFVGWEILCGVEGAV